MVETSDHEPLGASLRFFDFAIEDLLRFLFLRGGGGAFEGVSATGTSATPVPFRSQCG